jgi:hypothetical protein
MMMDDFAKEVQKQVKKGLKSVGHGMEYMGDELKDKFTNEVSGMGHTMSEWGHELIKKAAPVGQKAKEMTEKVEHFGDQVVSKVKDTFK